MASIDQIELPNGITYDISDASARKLDNNDFDTINVTELNAGDVIVTGAARFLNTINGDISGNAETATSATKATQDESGNNIKSTYANAISISDHTITLKNKNGTSLGTVTVPDNNTTYTVATGTANGKIKVTPSSGNAYEVSVYGLKSAAYKDVTDSYSATGTDPVSGKAVAAAIDGLPSPMVFKGSLGTGGTVTTLPVDGTAKVGDTYKVITAGTYASKSAKVGDTFICLTKTSSANTWELIPSGDEPSGTVTSVAVANGGGLSVSGSPITSSGTITISHADTSSQASVNNSGRTYIQDITLDTYGHVTGITSATETVVDTDRYVNSAAFADATSADANNPVKMTLTRAGSDTASVTAYLPKVSSSSAGVAPKGAAVSTQSQTTKFLREDGTWAAPSYTTNTNTTYSLSASGESVVLTGSDSSSKSVSLSTLINGLSEGSSPATSGDYIVAQYAGGGTTTKTYHRRKLSNIFKAMSSNDITTALGYTPPHEPVKDIPNTPTPIASFTDGASLPMASLKVAVTPYQDLHGYDAPWAGGAGKNKFNCTATTQTKNQVTFTINNDGTVSLSGTASATASVLLGSITLSTGTYILSGGASDDIYLNIQNPVYYSKASETQFTVESETTFYMFATVYQGVNATGKVLKPMIRLATETDATFAPYSNICPISGWDEANVSVSGVNVWDEEWELGGISNTTGQNTTNNSTIRTKNYIPVVPNTQYYINSNKWQFISGYDADKNFVGTVPYASSGTGYYINVPSNVHYIRIPFSTAYGTTYNNDISINYPSTDIEYHAYNGHTYTIDLDGTRYGGTLDVVNGEGTDRFGYVDLGTLNYTYYSGNLFTASISDLKPIPNAELCNALCSIYVAERGNEYASIDGSFVAGFNNAPNLAIHDSRFADATAFKQAMNGVQLVYELATPLTIQLAPTPAKSIEGENNISANCGQITEGKYVVQDYSDITSKISEFAQLATTASKLGSSNVGSATQPIYLNGGTATACTYTLGKSVPSDAVFTDTKNTAGSTDTSSKIYLIGATSQAANPQTYSQDTAYVGTDGCVYSDGNKVEVVSNNAGYHNSVYRGKSLGTSITEAQWASISAGTFEDMYIGDYWTLSTTLGSTTSNVQYVIAGFDYWWNCGDSYPQSSNKHHVVLVPASYLYSAQMNATNITTGGYIGSAMYTTNLANARTGISTLFGDHLYSVRRLFTNSVNTVGQATGWTWATSSVDLMSETMVYGHPVWTTSGFEVGVDRTILPLFALNPASASIRSGWWLRSVATPSSFAGVDSGGCANYYYASYSGGVRPAFAIY